MKTFSFIAGNQYDPSRGMKVGIDRSKLPPSMKLRMQLDDDGRAFPKLPRTAARHARAGDCAAHIEFIERTRLHVRLGSMEGQIQLEAGSRIELVDKVGLGDVRATGASISMRGSRRVADITSHVAAFEIDKQPNDFHVFTIEAEKPVGARPGDMYRVDVTQADADGNVVGGIAVMFTFD